MRSKLILLACLLAACSNQPGAIPAGDLASSQAVGGIRRPQPTEHHLDEGAERRHKDARRRWIEELHRAAPGVDWRAVERVNGEREQARRNALARSTQGGGVLAASAGQWTEVGSKNQAGRMHCAVIGSDGATLFAGSNLGGLWKGTLAGTGWVPLGDNLYGGVQQLVALPGETAGAPDVLLIHGSSGLRATRDLGQVWEQPAGVQHVTSFRNLARLGASTAILCAQVPGIGNVTSILASTDHGRQFVARWTAQQGGPGAIWIPRKGAAAATTIYMARRGRVERSTDGGFSFTALGTYDSASTDAWITGSEAGAPTLYVMSRSSNVWRLHRSSDAGATFTLVHTPADYWGALNASTINANVVMYGAVEAWRSSNGGASFTKINGWGEYYSNPLNRLHADIMGLQSWPDPADASKEIWYISTDGGVYESKASGLQPRNLSMSGLGVSQYYSTLSSRTDTSLILAGSQDQGYQRGSYASPTGPGPSTAFAQLISGDYGHLTSSDGSHDLVYSVYPGFVLVQEGQDNPVLLSPFLDFPAGSDHSWMPPVVADPLDAEVFYFCGDRLTRYTRVSGATWSQAQHSLQDFTAGGAAYLSALAFSQADAQRAYAATNNGLLYASSDHGVSWGPGLAGGPAQHYFYGTAIDTHPLDPLEAAVGGSGYSNPGVLRTVDGGLSWQPEVDGLPATLVYDLCYAPDGSGDLYAATQTGAYHWRRQTGQWQNLMGLQAPLTLYWSVEAVGNDLVRFGTYGRGIWDYRILGGASWSSFGTGKPNSLGLSPEIGALGTPSAAVNDLRATVVFGVPGQPGIVIESDSKAAQPFQGGTLYLAPPILRGSAFTFDTFGYGQAPIPVTPAMVGSVRYYQIWYRDPQHPDLTLTGLSNALGVSFGP